MMYKTIWVTQQKTLTRHITTVTEDNMPELAKKFGGTIIYSNGEPRLVCGGYLFWAGSLITWEGKDVDLKDGSWTNV